jgi:hypothetical protein
VRGAWDWRRLVSRLGQLASAGTIDRLPGEAKSSQVPEGFGSLEDLAVSDGAPTYGGLTSAAANANRAADGGRNPEP